MSPEFCALQKLTPVLLIAGVQTALLLLLFWGVGYAHEVKFLKFNLTEFKQDTIVSFDNYYFRGNKLYSIGKLNAPLKGAQFFYKNVKVLFDKIAKPDFIAP